MSGLPEVTVVGTLTADPELRYTANGVAVANFTVAANDRRPDPATGQWVDADATFLRCSIWRQAAENVVESLRRGQRVLVTGRLKQRGYETKEGEKRTVFELDVAEIGPSLRWARARVAKVGRAGGNHAHAATGPAGPSDDPWTATGPAGQNTSTSTESTPAAPGTDEPPF